jgi:cytochrome c-type biogenesis protein CcmF
VIVGTLYPLALEALTGQRISVGAPFFNLTFVPLVVPLLAIVPFGPMLAWKRGDIGAAAQRLMLAFGLTLGATIIGADFAGAGMTLPLLGVWLGLWLIAGALSEIAFRTKLGFVGFGDTLRRAAGLPRSAWGTTFAHAGMGVTVLGIVIATTWAGETIRTMRVGDSADLGSYTITLNGFVDRPSADYAETAVQFSVRQGGNIIAVMEPSKRRFATRQTETTEAGIRTFGFSQLYISLGDIAADGSVTVRIFWKPWVTFTWLGAVLMALGGLLSLSDRRFRVGVPKSARRREVVAAE